MSPSLPTFAEQCIVGIWGGSAFGVGPTERIENVCLVLAIQILCGFLIQFIKILLALSSGLRNPNQYVLQKLILSWQLSTCMNDHLIFQYPQWKCPRFHYLLSDLLHLTSNYDRKSLEQPTALTLAEMSIGKHDKDFADTVLIRIRFGLLNTPYTKGRRIRLLLADEELYQEYTDERVYERDMAMASRRRRSNAFRRIRWVEHENWWVYFMSESTNTILQIKRG